MKVKQGLEPPLESDAAISLSPESDAGARHFFSPFISHSDLVSMLHEQASRQSRSPVWNKAECPGGRTIFETSSHNEAAVRETLVRELIECSGEEQSSKTAPVPVSLK